MPCPGASWVRVLREMPRPEASWIGVHSGMPCPGAIWVGSGEGGGTQPADGCIDSCMKGRKEEMPAAMPLFICSTAGSAIN